MNVRQTAGLLLALLMTTMTLMGAPLASTTIDFLDYAFYDMEGRNEWFPLTVYEKRIRALADAGIRKLYLRVNARGLTLYPSKVTPMYGQNNLYHWHMPKQAQRLMNTLKAYDPCKETIRLGKKYGLEVWCWDSMYEDGGLDYFKPRDKRHAALARQCYYDPFNTPFFLKHPQCYVQKDPKLMARCEEGTAENTNGRHTVKTIVLKEYKKRRSPVRFSKEDLLIYISQDNQSYEPYKGNFTFSASVIDGKNTVKLEGLNIQKPYIVLAFKKPFDKNSKLVTMSSAKNNRTHQHLLFDEKGQRLPATWTVDTLADNNLHDSPLSFTDSSAEGWDFGSRRMGCHVGKHQETSYFRGVVEYSEPQTKIFKLARFKELTAYDFDGFMFNFRSHWHMSYPEQFGYNQPVRNEYLKRHGIDIWQQDADPQKMALIRAEAVANFLRECKSMTGGRPVYISGVAPRHWLQNHSQPQLPLGIHRNATLLPILYDRMIADESIDGIMMAGADFSAFFAEMGIPRQKLKLGVFRETNHLLQSPPKSYDFLKDLQNIHDSNLDEVELYESIALTGNPKALETVKQIFKTIQQGSKEP